jgi:hypothetical protein
MATKSAKKTARPQDIPSSKATWNEISRFALTFDGYAYWRSNEKCAQVANRMREARVEVLRSCLFFEQRRWRWQERRPDAASMRYIRGLIQGIRKYPRET